MFGVLEHVSSPKKDIFEKRISVLNYHLCSVDASTKSALVELTRKGLDSIRIHDLVTHIFQ